MKKNKVIIFGIVIGFLNAGNVFAINSVHNDIDMIQHHFYKMGIELSNITYKEPDYMEESGNMLGIIGSYIYHNDVMLGIEGVFKYGQVDYEGRLQNGTSFSTNNIDDYIVEIRSLGGYDFEVSATIITPYVGLGYRYLFDGMGAVYEYGYDRESTYLYSPIGIVTSTTLQNGWSLGVTLEYDIFWKGVQKSHMSDLNYGYNDIKQDQDSGYGVRGSIKFQKAQFLIEPFVKYWSIDDSDVSTLLLHGYPTGKRYFEPKNNSTEIGLKISWQF